MSLLVKANREGAEIVRVTPQSAGWKYVGFEVFKLLPGEVLKPDTHGRELCIVLVGGSTTVDINGKSFGVIGERRNPFAH